MTIPQIARRFWPQVRPLRWWIALKLVLDAALTGISLLEIALFALVVDRVLVPTDLGPLAWIALTYIGLTLMSGVLSGLKDYLSTWISQGFLLDLRTDVFRHVLHLPMAQAALGAHIRYETLDGTEDLVIPRATQPGKVFRLRGRGVPDVNGRGRGDLLVQVVVDTPADLDGDSEELLRRLAATRGEDVAPAEVGFLSRIKSAFR